jgi:hypothetical protein
MHGVEKISTLLIARAEGTTRVSTTCRTAMGRSFGRRNCKWDPKRSFVEKEFELQKARLLSTISFSY